MFCSIPVVQQQQKQLCYTFFHDTFNLSRGGGGRGVVASRLNKKEQRKSTKKLNAISEIQKYVRPAKKNVIMK